MTSKDLLVRLHDDVLAIIDAVKELKHLPASTLNWKENSEKWSILECLEHLNRYSAYYNNALRISISRAKTSSDNFNVKSTWLGKKFIAMMHPDNTTKHKTFARMNPIHSSLTKEVIDTFLTNQDDLLDLIKAASKIDLNKTSIRVEFLRILRMNIGDALQFVIAHEQRHLKQALAARSNAETLVTPALKI